MTVCGEIMQTLKELMQKAPKYEELDDVGGMESYGVQMWGSRVEEWVAKVKLCVDDISALLAGLKGKELSLRKLWELYMKMPLRADFEGSDDDLETALFVWCLQMEKVFAEDLPEKEVKT